MTTDYQGSGAGFMGTLAPIVQHPSTPKSRSRSTPTLNISVSHPMFRRTLGAEGFVSGLKLARDCLTTGRYVFENRMTPVTALRPTMRMHG